MISSTRTPSRAKQLSDRWGQTENCTGSVESTSPEPAWKFARWPIFGKWGYTVPPPPSLSTTAAPRWRTPHPSHTRESLRTCVSVNDWPNHQLDLEPFFFFFYIDLHASSVQAWNAFLFDATLGFNNKHYELIIIINKFNFFKKIFNKIKYKF